MLLELLASVVLWTGFDQGAELKVTCAAVTLDVHQEFKSNPEPVAFWMEDKDYGHTWLYVVPMDIMPNGHIKLEPTEFWIEQIRSQKELKVRVQKQYYTFNLTGTSKLINCDGVVAE